MKNILFISNNNISSEGLSGGDRIFVELIRGWKSKLSIAVYCTGECFSVLKRYKVTRHLKIFLSAKTKKKITSFSNINYFFHGLNRTYFSLISLFKFSKYLRKYDYIYSASDFYPDTLPAFFLKFFNPKIVWIAGFYLFAPKPWQKDNPYRVNLTRFLTNIFYWLTQKLSYFLVYNFADLVFVTSKPDVDKFFSKKRPPDKIIIIQGGVDTTQSRNYKNSLISKKYLCVYLGRFHFQKGVLELIDIWKLVCRSIPSAKLAMIGNGQLLPDIKNKINSLNLKNNIDLYGFLDGEAKYKIFKNSLIVVHPATYDSGGMAAAEAMAWGLPAVSFDLEALKTYYPTGMIKTKCFDKQKFADNIIALYNSPRLLKKTSLQASHLINTVWSWQIRCQSIYNQVFN